MPASLFPDMDRSNSGLEDQRALQLAFELSMLGLSESPTTTEPEQINSAFGDENRGKKSQNMTECVPVPSSEHVAEIVGRQGENITLLFHASLTARLRGYNGGKHGLEGDHVLALLSHACLSLPRLARLPLLSGACLSAQPASSGMHIHIFRSKMGKLRAYAYFSLCLILLFL